MQPVGDQPAAAGELGGHRLHFILRPVQGGHAGDLAERRGAGYAVGRQPGNVRNQLLRHYAVAQPPARHRVALGKPVQNYGAVGHPRQGGNAVMLAGVQNVLVDFVGHHIQIRVGTRHLGHGFQLVPREGGTAGIFGGIEDEQPGALVDQFRQPGQVGMVGPFLQQAHRHGFGAAEFNHRLVDGKAGVGVDDLGAGFRQGQQRIEHNGLGPGGNHNLLPVGVNAPHFAAVAGHGLPQFRQTGRRAVVRIAVLQSLDAGLDNVGRGLKIGLPDFQVDDFAALGFQGAGPRQHFKSGFGAQTAHSGGNSHSVIPQKRR